MRPGARCASLHGYADLCRSLGVTPGPLLAGVGLDEACLSEPERWVPAAAVAELLERSAAGSGREDFGVLLAQLRRWSTVGPLSVVLREEPDLRSALGLLVRYEYTVSEAVRGAVDETDDGLAHLRLWFEMGEPVPTRQAIEHAVAALLGVVRSLRGPGWQPASVCLAHAPPRDPSEHLRLLGPRARFDARYSGLLLLQSDLAAPNVLAHPDDPLLLTYASRVLRSLPQPRVADLVREVRHVVAVLLPLRKCTMPRVARTLGMSTRTLHRRLLTEGPSFTEIVDDSRASLAERYLAVGRYTVGDVSTLLGFAAPSAFSRWFSRRYGLSPSAWRAAVGAA
jgi:AraC-like DNA-binding protein